MLPIFQAGPGSFSASLQDDGRTELSDIKGHLEIALLEKHFLREYSVMAFIKNIVILGIIKLCFCFTK